MLAVVVVIVVVVVADAVPVVVVVVLLAVVLVVAVAGQTGLVVRMSQVDDQVTSSARNGFDSGGGAARHGLGWERVRSRGCGQEVGALVAERVAGRRLLADEAGSARLTVRSDGTAARLTGQRRPRARHSHHFHTAVVRQVVQRVLLSYFVVDFGLRLILVPVRQQAVQLQIRCLRPAPRTGDHLMRRLGLDQLSLHPLVVWARTEGSSAVVV